MCKMGSFELEIHCRHSARWHDCVVSKSLLWKQSSRSSVSMRWGLSTVSFFLMTSFCFTLFCGSFEDDVAQVAESSDNYLNEYSKRGEKVRYARPKDRDDHSGHKRRKEVVEYIGCT